MNDTINKINNLINGFDENMLTFVLEFVTALKSDWSDASQKVCLSSNK